MERILWIDVETTGFGNRHDVINMAVLEEIAGTVVGEHLFRIQPRNWEEISEKSTEVHGITVEEMRTYADPSVALVSISPLFFGPFVMAGYNIKTLDKRMIKGFFEKFTEPGDDGLGLVNNTLGDMLFPVLERIDNAELIDVLTTVRLENFGLADNKLETVCKHLSIPHNPHDAMSDIKATRMLYRRLAGGLPVVGIPV